MSEGGRTPVGAYMLAVARLRADSTTAREIAALLGLDTGVAAEPRTLPRSPEVPTTGYQTTTTQPRPWEAPAPMARPGEDGTEPAPSAIAPDTGEVLELSVVRTAGPATHVSSSAPSPAKLDERDWIPRDLPFEPLLRPVATRALVSAALAQPRLLGPLDVPALVDMVARGRPFRRVPRLPQWSLAARTRVLIDCGPGLTPFARDADYFVNRIAAVASRDRTEVMTFWQTPALLGPSRDEARPMELPPAGTAVVAITDLGIARTGRPARGLHDDWLDLARKLRAQQSPLVLFVPYPPSRWPARLAVTLTLVPWDRTTSVGSVIAALRGRENGGRAPASPP